MAWSTSELAELAGVTVNTVRHYHRLGLLPQPERRLNGYKQYGVSHLVCLLRIRRLVDLGVPLAQIGDVSAGDESTPDALREIDAQLAAQIERLQRARDDIALVLEGKGPADAPAGFESVASRLSQADSSMLHIYSQLYDESALADLREMVEVEPDALSKAVDTLPADADEATRQDLAERLAPSLAESLIAYPWMNDPASLLSKSEHVTPQTFVDAVVELYNPAQLDVLYRASMLARKQIEESTEGA